MRMRTFHWLLLVGISLLLVAAACSRSAPQRESPLRPTSTVKDLMDSMVDPSADVLWDSVATIVSASGTEERAPRTDEDWAKVRHNAITLAEATNLLVMDGRRVARPGEKAENPKVELGPEEIEAVISQDRQAFVTLAHALNDAAMAALKGIDAKDVKGLFDAGEAIDTACENCHLKYWYPLSHQQAEANKK
jgi:hypothetical protein